MLNILDWNKKIKVNGEIFKNSAEAYESFKDFKGEVKIELNFVEVEAREVGNIEQRDGVYYF